MLTYCETLIKRTWYFYAMIVPRLFLVDYRFPHCFITFLFLIPDF